MFQVVKIKVFNSCAFSLVEWWCKTLGAEYLDFYAIDIKVSDCTFKLKKPIHVKAKDEEQAVKYKFIKPIHVKAKDEE